MAEHTRNDNVFDLSDLSNDISVKEFRSLRPIHTDGTDAADASEGAEAVQNAETTGDKMRGMGPHETTQMIAEHHAHAVGASAASAALDLKDYQQVLAQKLEHKAASTHERGEHAERQQRHNGLVLIDDEDQLAQRLWAEGSQFYFGSVFGQHPNGIDYTGVRYVAILTMNKNGDQRVFAVNTPQVAGNNLAVVGRTLRGGDVLLPPQRLGQLDIFANVGPITVGQELHLAVRDTDDPEDKAAPLRQVGAGTVDRILIVYETGLNNYMERHDLTRGDADRIAQGFGDDLRDYTLASFRVTAPGARQPFRDVQHLLPPSPEQ